MGEGSSRGMAAGVVTNKVRAHLRVYILVNITESRIVLIIVLNSVPSFPTRLMPQMRQLCHRP